MSNNNSAARYYGDSRGRDVQYYSGSTYAGSSSSHSSRASSEDKYPKPEDSIYKPAPKPKPKPKPIVHNESKYRDTVPYPPRRREQDVGYNQ